MTDDLKYDIFLNHCPKDKPVVRAVAEQLRADGLRVWFDEWVLKAGDSIPTKIEEGLEQWRVLVLCMSANAFGSDWAQLEAGKFRFRDPLNKERHFIPLRLDDGSEKSSSFGIGLLFKVAQHRSFTSIDSGQPCDVSRRQGQLDVCRLLASRVHGRRSSR